MRRVAVAVVIAGLAAAAQAKPGGTLATPKGWSADVELAGKLADPKRVRQLPATSTPADVVYEAYRPAQPGAMLYVAWFEAAVAPDRRDAIATAELGELTGAMRRQGAGVQAESSSQKADPAARQLEAAVRWRDVKAGLITSARMVITADAARLQIAKAECMIAADAPAAIATGCEDALATLGTNLAAPQRVALAIVAAPEAIEPPAPSPAPTGSSAPAPAGEPRASAPARLDDGSKAVLPPIPIEPARREADRRPIYVGGGLIVMAAIFYWNRRRRERFERDDVADAPASKPAAARDDDDDDDADDLHAAAAEPARPQPTEDKR